MRVMVLVKATDDSEKGYSPDPWTTEMMQAMGRFNDELRKAGILLMAEGLTPSSQGKRAEPGHEGGKRAGFHVPVLPKPVSSRSHC